MGKQPPTQGWGGLAGGTFADQQHAVVAEAGGALAPEAPDLVDADATGAEGGDLPTLVDVWGGRQLSGAAQPQGASRGALSQAPPRSRPPPLTPHGLATSFQPSAQNQGFCSGPNPSATRERAGCGTKSRRCVCLLTENPPAAAQQGCLCLLGGHTMACLEGTQLSEGSRCENLYHTTPGV